LFQTAITSLEELKYIMKINPKSIKFKNSRMELKKIKKSSTYKVKLEIS
jgi:hypothetical protein